jgi:hypothetical protein
MEPDSRGIVIIVAALSDSHPIGDVEREPRVGRSDTDVTFEKDLLSIELDIAAHSTCSPFHWLKTVGLSAGCLHGLGRLQRL